MMKTPSFWYQSTVSPYALILLPFGMLMLVSGWVRRVFIKPQYKNRHSRIICVGNITAGGTGKTPLIMALAEAGQNLGFKPVALMHGYGGDAPSPTLVGGDMSAQYTGDEALMLSQILPVVVAKNRRLGVEFIEDNALGTLILIDDGMQNPNTPKDYTIALFNGRWGIGNGLPVPAGPLRERLSGLKRADSIAITGADKTGLAAQIKSRFPNRVIYTVERSLNGDDIRAIGNRPVVAFAGIADPDGFFMMLSGAGVNIAHTIAYPDHEPITPNMLADLHQHALYHNARLVTTSKDYARLGARSGGIIPIRLETTVPKTLIDRVFQQ